MKIKCRFKIHNWNKWKDIGNHDTDYGHSHQNRECIDCLIKQRRWYDNTYIS